MSCASIARVHEISGLGISVTAASHLQTEASQLLRQMQNGRMKRSDPYESLAAASAPSQLLGAGPNCACDSFQKPRNQVANMSASRSPARARSES